MRVLLSLFFLGGCTVFNTGNYCGGFPNAPLINRIESEGEVVEMIGNMKFYIDKTEKAKRECKYVK